MFLLREKEEGERRKKAMVALQFFIWLLEGWFYLISPPKKTVLEGRSLLFWRLRSQTFPPPPPPLKKKKKMLDGRSIFVGYGLQHSAGDILYT